MRSLFARETLDVELDEELRYHVERQIEEDIAAGISPETARRAALRSVSGLTQRKEECRDMRGWSFFDNLVRDLRFAIRQSRQSWGFTSTAILMLALGLCASVAIFAFVDAALIRPLPYRDPARLAGVFGKIPFCPRCNLSYPDFLDIQKLNQVFTSSAIYQAQQYVLQTDDGTEPVRGARVSAGFLRTLGVAPIAGRDFTDDEGRPGGPPMALISYDTWQKRYGGKAGVIGTSVTFSSEPATIIGVLPRGFQFATVGRPEYWALFHPVGKCDQSRGCHGLFAVARLRDGVTVQTARANIQSIAQQLETQYPDTNRGQATDVLPLDESIVGTVRPILLVLLSGAGLLLLIAAVNVASLLLVRTESRRREIAVRSGLGASRGRLMSQFVTEGLVLVACGTALGLLAARWTMMLLLRLIPAQLLSYTPYLADLGFNWRVMAFAATVAVLAAGLFTFMPASRVLATDLRTDLAEGSRGLSGGFWRRLGSNLVVVELATAVVLLVSAGLLGKSLYLILRVDLGMRPDHLATLRVISPPSHFGNDAKTVALARQVVSRMDAVPGVVSSALSTMLPVQGGNTVWIQIDGRPDNGEHNEVSIREVTPAYFSTLGATLVRGRYFTDWEDLSKPPVIVIDESLARKYFLGEDPIGKKIRYFRSNSTPPMEVVGVIASIKEGELDKQTWPTMYASLYQEAHRDFIVVARTTHDEHSVLASLAAAIRQIDPGITTLDPASMSDRINDSPAAYLRRCSAWVVGGFAGAALVLGVIGLYGVIAYSVSRRTREIGVRIALGAKPGTVYRLVLTEAGRLIGIGLVAGLASSVATAGLLRSLLFGVKSWDGAILAGVGVLLALCGMAATFLPARRAATVNPVEALRAE